MSPWPVGLVASQRTVTGPTTLAQDTFNRADGNLNGSTASDGVHTWTADAAFTTSSNVCQVAGSGEAIIDAGATDVTVSVTITQTAMKVGLVARYVDTNNFYVTDNLSNGLIRFYKVVSGSWTSLGSFAGSLTNGHKLSLVCKGSSIKTMIDDVVIHDVTDTSLTSGTKVGLRAEGGDTKKVDSFLVTTS